MQLRTFSVPMRHRFRRVTSREGVLLQGAAGWGEFSPFPDYGPRSRRRGWRRPARRPRSRSRIRCATGCR
jgi:hypothetical protein